MKKILILLVILAFVLASCAKETKVVITEGVPSAEQTAPQQAGQQQATASAAATPNVRELELDGDDCLNAGVRVCRPVNYKIGSVGDTIGFAFGMANLFNEPKKFTIRLKYVRTQQAVGQNAIEADKDTMGQWLAVNNIDSFYELQAGQKLSKPILVKIGDVVADGKPTVPGTYVFEIQAQTYENGFYNNYEGPQEISVKVK